MSMILAVDSGGTKADLLLASETEVLARVRTGTIKRMRATEAQAEANLHAAFRELEARSGVELSGVSHTCLGTAGEKVPAVTEFLHSRFRARVGGSLEICGDVEIALDAAFGEAPGVLVLAGTGSNVAARGADGEVVTAGGWGPVAADQGSGHRLGVQAVRAVFLARDERRETSLERELLAHWGLSTVEEMVAWVHGEPSPDFSRLVPLLLRSSNTGDAVAREVIAREAGDLAYLVRLLLRRLGLHGAAQEAGVGIAFAGSVMEHVAPLRTALMEDVRRQFPSIVERPGVVDPVLGALWRGRRAGAARPEPARQGDSW